MQDVETKAEEEGNTVDCTLEEQEEEVGGQFVVEGMKKNPFMCC